VSLAAHHFKGLFYGGEYGDMEYRFVRRVQPIGATHEESCFDCYGVIMMNPVAHFEFPYDNPLRMAKFYEAVFGWQTQRLGEEMGNTSLQPRLKPVSAALKSPVRLTGPFTQENQSGRRNIRPWSFRSMTSMNQ
jgi:hypothetical protein